MWGRDKTSPTSKEILVTACALRGGQELPHDREVTAAHRYETQICEFSAESHLLEPSHLNRGLYCPPLILARIQWNPGNSQNSGGIKFGRGACQIDPMIPMEFRTEFKFCQNGSWNHPEGMHSRNSTERNPLLLPQCPAMLEMALVTRRKARAQMHDHGG